MGCQPHPLPEHFVGKTLFPAITFRNVSVEVNFGPKPRAPLPFTCRMLNDAAAADVELVQDATVGKGGKAEVVLPIAMPDKGFFEWCDMFIARNPSYIELSDRKIIEWASKSGLMQPKRGGSNDRPDLKFNHPLMEDGSIRKVITACAPAQKRNYLI